MNQQPTSQQWQSLDDYDQFTAWTEDMFIAYMKGIGWTFMGLLFIAAAYGFLG